MGKTRGLFKKTRDTKENFHAKMGTIKDRKHMDLTEEDIKKRWQEYIEELYKKDLNDPDNHSGMITHLQTSLVAQRVKRLSTMWETWVQALGWEDPLEKEMAIHSSTIAWKIPRTEEPGRLQSMGSQRVRHD